MLLRIMRQLSRRLFLSRRDFYIFVIHNAVIVVVVVVGGGRVIVKHRRGRTVDGPRFLA